MMSAGSLREHLRGFVYTGDDAKKARNTMVMEREVSGKKLDHFVNQFWTSRQRQANSLHEISYRACFKGQLPRFFISRLTDRGDVVYDPFAGRGTTSVEAALNGRVPIFNDINPLSSVLIPPRLSPPTKDEVVDRIRSLNLTEGKEPDMDLSMFYHERTLEEIVALRTYLLDRERDGSLDDADRWIRMVATNRLTGHSRGFFSVYTLPPNQAILPQRQVLINRKRDQVPDYRDVGRIIIKKTRSLLRDIGHGERSSLAWSGERALGLNKDAARTKDIHDGSVDLTVTSPPFLDVVQYSVDNWLRCWFNGLDAESIEKSMTLPSSVKDWEDYMGGVFRELYRITREGGWVAFEVGEVRNGSIDLADSVVPLGLDAGFECAGVLINSHEFTKTSNIWGVNNNTKGTNSNRVVLLRK